MEGSNDAVIHPNPPPSTMICRELEHDDDEPIKSDTIKHEDAATAATATAIADNDCKNISNDSSHDNKGIKLINIQDCKFSIVKVENDIKDDNINEQNPAGQEEKPKELHSTSTMDNKTNIIADEIAGHNSGGNNNNTTTMDE